MCGEGVVEREEGIVKPVLGGREGGRGGGREGKRGGGVARGGGREAGGEGGKEEKWETLRLVPVLPSLLSSLPPFRSLFGDDTVPPPFVTYLLVHAQSPRFPLSEEVCPEALLEGEGSAVRKGDGIVAEKAPPLTRGGGGWGRREGEF